MTPPDPRRIVVGADGSEQAGAAVAWAAREAVLRHRPLVIVHAFVWPLLRVATGPLPDSPPDTGLRAAAEQLLAAAATTARQAAPDVEVTTELVTGRPTAVLLAQSHSAAMVVTGNRGLGGFTGLLAGSVAVPVAAHAACPVVVVRPTGPAGPSAGRVVVAVNGSSQSELLLDFAFEEAAWRGVGLTAVHAWTRPTSTGPDDPLPLVYDVDAVAGEEERLLSEQLAGLPGRYPDVEVRPRVVRGRPAKVVVEESEGAELLVVGSRGRGGFRGMLLGSVSHAALHHAGCPVAILRRPAQR